MKNCLQFLTVSKWQISMHKRVGFQQKFIDGLQWQIITSSSTPLTELHYTPSSFTIEHENSHVLARIWTAVLLQTTHRHCTQHRHCTLHVVKLLVIKLRSLHSIHS